MNIVVNAILFHEKPRGVGRYLNSLLSEISKIDTVNKYYIYYAPWMREYEFLKIDNKNFNFICLNLIPRNKILRNIYQGLIFPLVILKHRPDILHIPDTSPVFFTTCKTISTIHDLAEFHFPEKYSRVQSILRKILVKIQSKKSHKIITISSYSKKDIIDKLGVESNKVQVIFNGVDSHRFKKLIKSSNLPSKIENKKYFLYVGEIERTKNVPIIIEAFNDLPKKIQNEYDLVIAGKKGNDYKKVLDMIEKYKLGNKIHLLNYVDEEQLVNLYNNCKCFIFPSLFEGFGLPILEAMSCGTCVLSSNSSSLPEVGGKSVIYFDPYNKNDLKDKIEKIINNSELYEKIKNSGLRRAKKFTWYNTAIETLKVYNNSIKD